MKKIFLQFLSLGALALNANAQFNVGAQGSYLTGHGKNDNHATLTGVTAFGSYAITDKMAVGTVIHSYNAKPSKYKSGDFSYVAYDDVLNVSVSYEVAMGTVANILQPFMGVDMGVSTSHHKGFYLNDIQKEQRFTIQQQYVMLSPKVGMSVALSKNFGIYTQAQYNFSPGNGGKTTVYVQNSKSVGMFTTEPISKYYNIDTGVYMLIGNIKNIL